MIESIPPETVTRIARHLFGERTRVTSIQEVVTTEAHGITKVAESTRNLLYVVEVAAPAQSFVFRFHRGAGDDRYEQEVRNYRLLAEHTGVRVPTVHAVDPSCRLAPTAYMVMEYLAGEAWMYLAHPDNPETTRQDKKAIRRAVGRFYARVHSIRREPEPPDAEARTVLRTLDQLEQAVRRGFVDVASRAIDRCRRAVRRELAFKQERLSLCLADTEIHVAKNGMAWEPAFVCDPEWMAYRHRYADLVPRLAGSAPWWEIDRLLASGDPEHIAARPFFRGYEALRPIDYEELLRLAPYYQLGLWAYLANENSPPEKKQWIRQKEPLIQELVRHVAAL